MLFTNLRVEQLESRLVLDGMGWHAFSAPVGGWMAGHAVAFEPQFNSRTDLDFVLTNPLIGPGFAQSQFFSQPSFEWLPPPSWTPPPGESGWLSGVGFPEGYSGQERVVVPPDINPFIVVSESPPAPTFRPLMGPTLPNESPTPTIQAGPYESSIHPATANSSDIGSAPGQERAALPTSTISTVRQIVPLLQTVFAGSSRDVQSLAVRDMGTLMPQRLDGGGAALGDLVQPGRDEGGTLPESVTPPTSEALSAEGAGPLTGGLPFGLGALERTVRELLGAESSSIASALSPYLRWSGLGAWLVSAALAYVAVRQRSKRTRDFDDVSEIAARNKDPR